jgi:hypothetical protein
VLQRNQRGPIMQSLLFTSLISQSDRVTGTYGQAVEIKVDLQKACFIFSQINNGGHAPIEVPFTKKENLGDYINWMFTITPQRSGMLDQEQRRKLTASLVMLAELYVDHPVFTI